MQRCLLLLFFVISSTLLAVSQISVLSFKALPNDLTARLKETKELDQNGEVCAIIKVVSTETGFNFDTGMSGIVKTVQKPSEIWVYVPRGTKRITITHEKLGMLRDHILGQAIEAACVYELVLTSDKVVNTVVKRETETQYLTIISNPDSADIFINDQPAGKTPFLREMVLGNYKWSIQKELYQSDGGFVDLKGGEAVSLSVPLKPDFGSLTVTSTPESGAQISLDQQPTGKQTPYTFERVPTGTHGVTVSRDMFVTTKASVSISPEDSKIINIKMAPTYSDVSIQTDPPSDIYINGDLKANNIWKGRLNMGIYNFEARLDKYTSALQKQQVETGVPLNIVLRPTPRYGTVKIISNPFGATIKLNGEEIGKTPLNVKNKLIGDYTLELSKEGYGVLRKQVTISDLTITEINEQLSSGVNVNFTTNPSNARLTIDSKFVGMTPYTGLVNLGAHRIQISNGNLFTNIDETINITENQTAFTYNLTTKGKNLSITSNPVGAQVWLNNLYHGTTPINEYLEFGDYPIQLKKDKYTTFSSTLYLRNTTPDQLAYKMEPVPNTLDYGSNDNAYTNRNAVRQQRVSNTPSNKENASSIKDFTSFGLYVNTQSISFSNDTYLSNIENGEIVETAGMGMGMYLHAYPTRIDVCGLMTNFDLPSWNLDDEGWSLFHYAAEASISMDIIHLGKFFFLYGGLGYQVSSLRLTDENSEDLSVMNTSSPFAKVGAQLLLSRLSLFGEYNYHILTSNKADNRQIRFGMGIDFH